MDGTKRKNENPQSKQEEKEEERQGLIPGLPDEIAVECLVRVPYQSHSSLKSVCHGWRNLICSPQFYQERRKSGKAEHLVCLVQPLPTPLSPPATPDTDTHLKTTSTKKQEEDDQQNQQQHQIFNPPQYGLNIYNASRDSWRRTRPGNERIPMFCQCVALPSCGKLVLLGGWDPATLEPVSDVYVVDMFAGSCSWRRAAPMSVPRSFFACAVGGGSKLYVAGGHDNQKNALRSAEVYDVEENRWEMLPDMGEERDECQGLSWEGDSRFWVVSGYGTERQGEFRSDAECYDPKTGSWSKFEGVWPFAGTSPRGNTTTITTHNKSSGQQFQWWWFLGSDQQEQQQQQLQSNDNGGIKEHGEQDKMWKTVSCVKLPNSILGTPPCVADLGVDTDKNRVFVMSGVGGSRGASSCSECGECEGEVGFMMERDEKNSNATKWNHIHVPKEFAGFPFSASCILI